VVLGEALSAGITELTAIACRSTSVCEAAGDSALAVQTTDGGARRVSVTLPAGATGVEAIACPSTRICEAVDGDLAFRTTDGGRTWVSVTLPAGATGVEAIACPSTRICEAVDGDLAFRTTDGGRTWVSGTLPSGSGQAEAIACPSTSVCEVVGQSSGLAMRTTNGGKSWVSQPATGVEGFNAFSCPSTSVCEAIGVSSAGLEEALRTTDGGARCVGQKLPYNLGDVDAIACASASACERCDLGERRRNPVRLSHYLALPGSRRELQRPERRCYSHDRRRQAVAEHQAAIDLWQDIQRGRLSHELYLRSDRRGSCGRCLRPQLGPPRRGLPYHRRRFELAVPDRALRHLRALVGRLSLSLVLRGRRRRARWCGRYPPSLIRRHRPRGAIPGHGRSRSAALNGFSGRVRR
jgi:photosystem II stability/assembly factor-like uncharacterized protein